MEACDSDGKESACNMGDLGLIPGLGRSSGGGHGNPLQYSCLENPMDRGAWQAAVHGVAKSGTRLSNGERHVANSQLVLASGVQHRDSVYASVYMHTDRVFFRFFSIIGYHRVLNIVPCAID